jgi:hypothetical protein
LVVEIRIATQGVDSHCFPVLVSSLQKLKLDSCLSPYTNINLKWIKDLNIRSQTLKLVQKKVRNSLELIGMGKDFSMELQQLSN